MRRSRRLAVAAFLVMLGVAQAQNGKRIDLHSGWAIDSAAAVTDKGDVLSRPSYEARNWYQTTVPSTVVAAMVADKVFNDPGYGINLRSYPGVNYAIGRNFATLQMPPGSPFRGGWWYRTKFEIPSSAADKNIQLHFDGINYRANVWLNGRQIANAKQVAGMWRLYEFDVTGLVEAGPNALAIEVFPPAPRDLANTFVDWNPMPPDKGMGLWREVYLTMSGPVSIRLPQVRTKLDLPDLENAHLEVTAEVRNNTDRAVAGIFKGEIETIRFEQRVALESRQSKTVRFTPAAYAQLNVEHPKLWWPYQMGDPALHALKLQFIVGDAISDLNESRFGMREVTSEQVAQQPPVIGGKDEVPRTNILFRVNGQKVLIRGGGYSFDMLLRADPVKQEEELDYVRDMHLNAVRLEGKLADDHFLDLADEKGILVMAGWSCCDQWEQWKHWDDEDYAVASASMRDQIGRLRSHPSLFVWLNGSDNPPPADQERRYIAILKELNWPNPYISSATSRATSVTGESGVKMLGPYDYVASDYWLTDHSLGGAYGFNTETGPGPAVPPIDSLREMLPEDKLWPINSWWNFHAGGGAFSTIDVFTEALNKRYGTASNVEDYALKAQMLAYEDERAMFEAFGRNKYAATGVIQWMLNNAWPSMIWHL